MLAADETGEVPAAPVRRRWRPTRGRDAGDPVMAQTPHPRPGDIVSAGLTWKRLAVVPTARGCLGRPWGGSPGAVSDVPEDDSCESWREGALCPRRVTRALGRWSRPLGRWHECQACPWERRRGPLLRRQHGTFRSSV